MYNAACVFERWGALAGTDGKAWNIWRSFCRNLYQWLSMDVLCLWEFAKYDCSDGATYCSACSGSKATAPGSSGGCCSQARLCFGGGRNVNLPFAATDGSCHEQGQLISMFGMHRCIRLHSFWRTVGMNHEEPWSQFMSGHVKSFYMKVQSQSEQVCRWKMSWMASLRRIALSVGNSWLTPSWGLSLIRRNLAKLTKLSRGRYDILSWPKLEDELRWKRLQLHELTWSSCCLDFLDKFAAKWQLNTVKKQRSPGLTAVHQKMLKKSESKQARSEPRHPRSSERFLFCCRRCRGEGCGTGRHISHHSWPIGFLFSKVLLGDAFILPGFVMDGVLNVWRKCTFVR